MTAAFVLAQLTIRKRGDSCVADDGVCPSWIADNLDRYWRPLGEHLEDVRCPVVVTRGDRDPLSRHEWAASLTDRPRRTLVTVPGGGHTYMAADPAALATSLATGGFAGSEGSRS